MTSRARRGSAISSGSMLMPAASSTLMMVRPNHCGDWSLGVSKTRWTKPRSQTQKKEAIGPEGGKFQRQVLAQDQVCAVPSRNSAEPLSNPKLRRTAVSLSRKTTMMGRRRTLLCVQSGAASI